MFAEQNKHKAYGAYLELNENTQTIRDSGCEGISQTLLHVNPPTLGPDDFSGHICTRIVSDNPFIIQFDGRDVFTFQSVQNAQGQHELVPFNESGGFPQFGASYTTVRFQELDEDQRVAITWMYCLPEKLDQLVQNPQMLVHNGQTYQYRGGLVEIVE